MTLTNFREDFKVMATMLEEQYGLSISLGTINYPPSGTQFSCKLTALNVGDLAPTDNVEQAEFNINAGRFGFLKTDYNRISFIYGKPYKLVGFNLNARKNVCLVSSAQGTQYVMDAQSIQDGFK